jgi:hypothetical protein
MWDNLKGKDKYFQDANKKPHLLGKWGFIKNLNLI